MKQLWAATYGKHRYLSLFSGQVPQLEGFEHEFQDLDPEKGFIYIDRVCCRIPDAINDLHANKSAGDKQGKRSRSRGIQRSLTPHLDCCPHGPFPDRSKPYPKWRPIQSFIALTDTLEADQGGFECVRGFHKEFASWASSREGQVNRGGVLQPPPCVGDFTPIRPQQDAQVLQRVNHVSVPAGAAVFWDRKLPHANAAKNTSQQCRQVVYCGLIPYCEMNTNFAAHQLQKLSLRIKPTDQWVAQEERQEVAKDGMKWSELGLQLTGQLPWN
ncbi:unnamed protein product [Chrysoparadoxa australica]